jgi:hypothetical protein
LLRKIYDADVWFYNKGQIRFYTIFAMKAKIFANN